MAEQRRKDRPVRAPVRPRLHHRVALAGPLGYLDGEPRVLRHRSRGEGLEPGAVALKGDEEGAVAALERDFSLGDDCAAAAPPSVRREEDHRAVDEARDLRPLAAERELVQQAEGLARLGAWARVEL